MPLFDYRCPQCGHQEEVLVPPSFIDPIACPVCDQGGVGDYVPMTKLPPSVSFKIKGARATNNYGVKFEDSYGKSPVNDKETGCSFTSNRGFTLDHKFQVGE